MGCIVLGTGRLGI